MTVARFRVVAPLDCAGGAIPGTVEIDREAGLFVVRPLRRRKTYVLPLSAVATMVCQALVRREVAEERARRKGKNKRRTK